MSALFGNLLIWKLANWQVAADKLEELMATRPLHPCGNSDMQSLGWVPTKGPTFPLVHVCQQQLLITLGTENKLLPGSYLDSIVKARATEIEAQQGYKVGRREMKDLKELVTQELLPRAFVIPGRTVAWIDPVNGWFVVNATSDSAGDEILSALRAVLDVDALVLTQVKTEMSPKTAMTAWLAGKEAPAGFTIDRDCELSGQGDGKEAIRYVNNALDGEEIQDHIAAGKMVTKLAMTWNDRVSFVLTESMQIKRVKVLDVVKEANTNEDAFDGDFAMMAGEYAGLIGAVVAALGGLVEEKEEAAV